MTHGAFGIIPSKSNRDFVPKKSIIAKMKSTSKRQMESINISCNLQVHLDIDMIIKQKFFHIQIRFTLKEDLKNQQTSSTYL